MKTLVVGSFLSQIKSIGSGRAFATLCYDTQSIETHENEVVKYSHTGCFHILYTGLGSTLVETKIWAYENFIATLVY